MRRACMGEGLCILLLRNRSLCSCLGLCVWSWAASCCLPANCPINFLSPPLTRPPHFPPCSLLEQFRAAGGAQQASEARVAAAEAAAEAAKREAEARASTIRWLESQVSFLLSMGRGGRCWSTMKGDG